jgi:hypothetical protein
MVGFKGALCYCLYDSTCCTVLLPVGMKEAAQHSRCSSRNRADQIEDTHHSPPRVNEAEAKQQGAFTPPPPGGHPPIKGMDP